MKGKEDDYRNRNRIPCGDSCVFDRRKSIAGGNSGADRKNNGIICLSSRHSIRCCQRSTMLWEKHRNLQNFRTSFADRSKTQAMQSVLQQVSRTALFLSDEKELEHLGVQPLVMKGIVCRSLYPKPDLRRPGMRIF